MRTVLRILMVSALVLGLGATTCTPERQKIIAAVSLAETCDAYTAALTTIHPLIVSDRLTMRDLDNLELANSAADQFCKAPVPPANIADAVSQVSAATTKVLLILAAREEN